MRAPLTAATHPPRCRCTAHAAVTCSPRHRCRAQAWALWLRATSGALRVDCLARRVCGGPDEYALLTAVNAACGGAGGNATAAALSHLFSIYIHPPPSHKGYARGSIFRGREISPRVKVEWGSWSVMEVRPARHAPTSCARCTYPLWC